MFHPSDVRAAIVTCGGLCPGLNTVIRELVWGLWFQYGVRTVLGINVRGSRVDREREGASERERGSEGARE